jgi:hypothetical protein
MIALAWHGKADIRCEESQSADARDPNRQGQRLSYKVTQIRLG